MGFDRNRLERGLGDSLLKFLNFAVNLMGDPTRLEYVASAAHSSGRTLIMDYSDISNAYGGFTDSVAKLSELYEQVRKSLELAVVVDEKGGSTVDAKLLASALQMSAPPNSDGQVKALTSYINSGFAMQNGQIVAPWQAFQQPNLLTMYDAATLKSFGLGPNSPPSAVGSTRPVREPARLPLQPLRLGNVPAEVAAPANRAILHQALANLPKVQADLPSLGHALLPYAATSFGLLNNAAMVALVPASTGYVWSDGGDSSNSGDDPNNGWSGPTPSGSVGATGSTSQALTPQDVKKVGDCLAGAQFSWTAGCIVNVCFPAPCSESFESLLNLGTGVVLSFAGAILIKGFAAALAAAGGWVALGIAVSAAYWAVMIMANKTPRGVCLHIPMPWTLGLIGPGWATGL